MSKLIIVGGSIDRPSGVITKLHYLFKAISNFKNIDVFNGVGTPKDISTADMVLWFPDIDNKEIKTYPIKKQGAVLLCSKVMRNDTTRIDAVTRIFKMHGNAVTMIRKDKNSFEFELVDALNNTWIKTSNLKLFVDTICEFYSWTQNSKRFSLIHTPTHDSMWTLGEPDGLKDFIGINRALALKVAAGCKNRYFGNFSTRCTKLFPSKKISPTVFAFSPRNTDKRSITSKDLVLTSFKKYYGDRKPSVDTPVQLELYKNHPHINFMIHGHAYIKDCPYSTNKYFPCGDLREVDEILTLIEKGAIRINLRKHGFLLIGETIDDFYNHLNECQFKIIGQN